MNEISYEIFEDPKDPEIFWKKASSTGLCDVISVG